MIGVDLHSHVLPGMDDGSPSMDESLRMLGEMYRAGFRKIITTPHVNTSLYPNTREQILGQLYHLREVVAENHLDIEIEASGEYHLDYEFPGRVETGEVIPFGKKNYLLIELPFQKPSFPWEEILFQVQLANYEVVIAHPERYVWMLGNMKMFEKLKDRGMFFQLNINSLNGLYGFPVRMAAGKLLDAGMVDFTGSDAHYHGHVTDLWKVLQNRHFIRLLESGRLRNAEL